MHRGTGYLPNYLDGSLPPIAEHVQATYAPLLAGRAARLYLARQWCERSLVEERELGALPGVAGLVFSSFRHDNPGPIARGDWRAGKIISASPARAARPR